VVEERFDRMVACQGALEAFLMRRVPEEAVWSFS
jgi:hypothetical protein